MKEFKGKAFCDDLILLRGDSSQDKFAKQLDINRSSLSLLENGKQMPSIDILSKVCTLNGKNIDDYFIDVTTDSLVYLMGSLDDSDKKMIEEIVEKIRIKEKYELLAKRGNYVINR